MKGVYLLIVSIAKPIQIRVGALGNVSFEKGVYVYVGSAQNNLEKRVERHLKKVKRKFWHIDYLLENENVKILQVFYKVTGKSYECKLAKEISRKGTAIIGFGSSDCNCKSHLFRLNDYQSLKERMHSMKV
ncbi:MAG: GIY-YIG nuclease family protein [Candidatus Bathyarchaeia archaeon]